MFVRRPLRMAGLFWAAALIALTVLPGQEAQARTRRAALAAHDACGPVGCEPCIIYRDQSCYPDCAPTIKTVLCVWDPCSCCAVRVPVCLPACCSGEPSICARCGLFRRGIVRYDWCCGYSVQVIFRARGDVVVTYL